MYSHPLSPVYIYIAHISPLYLSLSLAFSTDPPNSLQSQGSKRKGTEPKNQVKLLTELGLHARLALPDAHARERDADLPELAPGPGVGVAGALARGADGHFALSVAYSSPKRPPPEMLANRSINQSNQSVNQSISHKGGGGQQGKTRGQSTDSTPTRTAAQPPPPGRPRAQRPCAPRLCSWCSESAGTRRASRAGSSCRSSARCRGRTWRRRRGACRRRLGLVRRRVGGK